MVKSWATESKVFEQAIPGADRPCALILFLLLGLLSSICYAEDIRATVTMDSAKILIGDQVHMKIEVSHPEDVVVATPENLAERLKPFEIVSQEKMHTTHTETGWVSTIQMVLTSFESGVKTIPALPIEYHKKGNRNEDIVCTAPFTMEVQNVTVDTKEDIRDVKPPHEVPLSWQEVLPYALGGMAAILLLCLVCYVWKKRRKGEQILPAPSLRPAHELAWEALQTLEAKRLWQNGHVKEYYSELTDILRNYVERSYGMPAMEMTTEDILASEVIRRWNEDLQKNLSSVLIPADLVKFAKMQPAPEENEKVLRAGFTFVERTRDSAMRSLAAGMITPESISVNVGR